MFCANKSTENLQIIKLNVSKEKRVTGKVACALRVSSHSYVLSNRPAALTELASLELKPSAVPLNHVDANFFNNLLVVTLRHEMKN